MQKKPKIDFNSQIQPSSAQRADFLRVSPFHAIFIYVYKFIHVLNSAYIIDRKASYLFENFFYVNLKNTRGNNFPVEYSYAKQNMDNCINPNFFSVLYILMNFQKSIIV